MTGGREGGAALLAAAALVAALPAAGQVGNGAAPVPSAAQTSIPVPPPPVIVLPTPTSTPVLRAAIAVPTPRPTPTPTPKPAPSPRSTAAVQPAPAPSAAPPPEAVAAPRVPIATASPSPSPVAPPTVVATRVSPTDTGERTGPYWLAGVVAAILVLGGLAWAWLRRWRGDADKRGGEAAAVEVAPVHAIATPRAHLAIAFRPRRAGLNMLSATSENEIIVTNTGDAIADDIRVQLRLVSAHGGQDAELAAFYAEPIGRAAVPPFTLASGEARAVSAVAALPRDAIRTLTAAGRPMFVPIVAVNILYDSGAGEGQLAQAFAVGVERVDSAKLAPFWLDTPPRSYDQVAARAHASALER